jgi:hypothetical protein
VAQQQIEQTELDNDRVSEAARVHMAGKTRLMWANEAVVIASMVGRLG